MITRKELDEIDVMMKSLLTNSENKLREMEKVLQDIENIPVDDLLSMLFVIIDWYAGETIAITNLCSKLSSLVRRFVNGEEKESTEVKNLYV